MIEMIKKLSIICILFITSPIISLAQFAGGSGTISDPYQIENPGQLDSVRNYLSMSFILNNDIDLNIPPYNTGEGWEPIGEGWWNPFVGAFNGNGHVIWNLMINSPEGDCLGIFGNIETGATIENLGIYGNIIGDSWVGGLVGNSYGKINNCFFSGSVVGDDYIGGLVGNQYDGTITNCYASGHVSGDSYVGGLVGYHDGTISDCNTANDVTGDSHVGGLVGYNYSKLTTHNLHATGNVNGGSYVGGLIGFNDGNLSSSDATGNVEGFGYSYHLGGLIGMNIGDTINNCFASGRVSGEDYIGGLVGYNYGTIMDCNTANDVTGIDFVGGLVGYNNSMFTKNTHATGNVTGKTYVGGLVGYNYGKLSSSYATGTVEGSGDCLGGLIGYNYGNISNCYATGNLRITGFSSQIGGLIGDHSGNMSDCYAAGSISTTETCEFLGGLAGKVYDNDIILNCFYNKETSGQDAGVGHGIHQVPGLSTEEMKNGASYIDWDFTDTWTILEGKSYPGLKQLDNAPFSFRDSLKIHKKTLVLPLLENDYDVESEQSSLVYKIEKLYGSGSIDAQGWFEFPENTEVNYTDSLRYRVGEARNLLGDTLWGNTAIVILINSNNQPIAVTDLFTTEEDTPITIYFNQILANDIDEDNDALFIDHFTSGYPKNGIVNIKSDNFIYTSNYNWSGRDTIKYVVSDGMESSEGIIIIEVTPVNDPPIISSTAPNSASELTEYIYVVTATDPENDELSYTLHDAPEGMVISDNIITWTPEKGVLTSGEVTLIVSDGYLSAIERFTITVEPSVITSTNITIGKKAGLLLYPNPVVSGEAFYLQVLNMEDVDLQGMTIMVYNSLGDMVYQSNGAKALNTLRLSNQTGLFIIRLTKADGKEFQGKLMVLK